MSAEICGHDRDALQKTLEFANALDLDGISRRWPQHDDAHGALLFDVLDPDKLAAIIAELLRERGLRASVEMDRPDNRLDVWVNHFPNDPHPSASLGIGIRSCRRGCFGERIVEDLDMTQARAFALALLDAPNATEQDIERMIGEATR